MTLLQSDITLAFIFGLFFVGSCVLGVFLALIATCLIDYVIDDVLFIEITNKTLGYTYLALSVLFSYLVFQYII